MKKTKRLCAALTMSALIGCTAGPTKTYLKDTEISFEPGTIISGKTGQPVSREELLADLQSVRIVYIGETHSDRSHHSTQLEIITDIFETGTQLAVGMEMFDITYQSVLDQWSRGEIDEAAFLEKVHWYANWRHPFGLYREILEFIQQNQIPLVGLNIPFHIPRKVGIGGLDNLTDADSRYVPQEIDKSDAAHRAYLEKIFQQHAFHGNRKFEYFYEVQCLWEETMAETIAREMPGGTLVVLAGNGHIVNKFGIPERAFRRNQLAYRTVYLAAAGSEIERSFGDYIWITAAGENSHRSRR